MNRSRHLLRRSLAFAALLGYLLLCSVAFAQEVRYRKHVDDMSPEEWKALGDAITALRANDVGMDQKPTPNNQPLNSYEYFVKMHGTLNRSLGWGCEHYSELIWPWHRAYMLQFEDALNAVKPPGAPMITIPYWDWTEPATGQNGFPAAYEVAGSPLNHDRNSYPRRTPPRSPLDERNNEPAGTAAALIKNMLELNSWIDFGGSAKTAKPKVKGELEALAHDEIHMYIGKENDNTVLSVRDPVFWAHHSNLDRLVGEWQRLHPDQPQCSDCDAVAYHDPYLGSITFRQLLDQDSLPVRGGGTVRVVYVPKGQGRQSTALFAQARMDAATKAIPEQVNFRFNFPDLTGGRLKLVLENVKVPLRHSYAADVYIYPANVTFKNSDEFSTKYKVGSFGQFAVEHENEANVEEGHAEHHPSVVRVQLDLTHANAVLASTAGRPYILTIVFKAPDKSQSYSEVQSEVHYSSIDLLREDFGATDKIELIPTGGTQ